jgi:hypothetical protein
MYRRIHDRLGTAGVVIAVIALIAALSGTAFAAKGALTGKQKKEVEKIAKKYAGKPGAPGAPGANGTNGKDGANGTNGKDGTDGTSATTTSFTGNGHGCTEGGIVVNSASPETAICNGKKGTAGKNVVVGTEGTGTANCNGDGGATVEVQGEAATKQYVCNGAKGDTGGFGGQDLASGATETGYWTLSTGGGDTEVWVPISFQQPVNASLYTVHYVPVGTNATDTVCGKGTGGAGGGPAEPKAPNGFLCIWEFLAEENHESNSVFDAVYNQPIGIGTLEGIINNTGALMRFTVTTPAEPAYNAGTWALTGA